MISRILCLLFGHKADYDFNTVTLTDDAHRNAFSIDGCKRCGECYIARHQVINRQYGHK